MTTAPANKEIKSLNVAFTGHDDIWLTSGYTLRKLIGILGMSLPLLLWLFLGIASNHYSVLESISHYYYTRAGSVFTIIVSLLAIFLFVYKGREPIDFYLSGIAGLFALCVLLFPTGNLVPELGDTSRPYATTYIAPAANSDFRETFHYISAAIFLLSLAFMSLLLFTRSRVSLKQRGRNKHIRNWIYVGCGIIMIVAILVIFIGGFLGAIPEDTYDRLSLTFWMETIAIEAFGFSWLVKGEAILKDGAGDTEQQRQAQLAL